MAYLYISIGHEGLGDRYRQLKLIAARRFIFSHKTSNRSRKWTFGFGHWKIIFFIFIKAAATIRNFTVLSRKKNYSPGGSHFDFDYLWKAENLIR